MSDLKFSFVIVTYNNADTIEPCLRSIAEYTQAEHEIIVVDNSPDKRTVSSIRGFSTARPDVRIQLLEPGENLGFSRACNAGAKLASGEFLFFLNPDTQLMNDAANRLLACFAAHPRTITVGPGIRDADGQVARSCRNLPNLRRVLLDATSLDRWFGDYKLTRFGHDLPRQVEQIIGAAILIRRHDYARVGGMDERFFIYFEEVDLCKRLREAGGEIWFWPDAIVQHLAGRSCESNPVRARMIFILRESRKKYFDKHFGAGSSALLSLINRLEGLQKSIALGTLWIIRRRLSDREKAHGFWSVAMGIAPRT